MSGFFNEVYYIALDILRDLAAELVGWALVLALLAPLLAVLFFVMKRAVARRGVDVNLHWNWGSPGRPAPPAPGGVVNPDAYSEVQAPAPAVDSLQQTRASLVKVYKGLLLGVGTILLAGAFYAAMVATTANGLALVAFLLFGLAVAAFAGMSRYDRSTGSWPRLSRHVNVSVQEMEPQVRFLDQAAIERAKDLSRQGVSLETICLEVNPEYGQWGSWQKQAFQKLLKAVLQHHSTVDAAPGT